MWRWDQGRLDYFQFDELRKIAKLAESTDLRQASHEELESATGLPFSPNRPDYRPWRNYGRAFQLAMIAVPEGRNRSRVTEIGKLLARDGQITTDEYFHFLAQATTDPSPVFSANAWDRAEDHRYPLLFVLRFLLARASQELSTTTIDHIVGAYETSGFLGLESQSEYLGIIFDESLATGAERQAAESIKVLAQISYLTATGSDITVSLAPEDAVSLFEDLSPVGGKQREDTSQEILRVASLYPSATAELSFEYPATVISDAEQAGFSEGGRVRRTHLTLERNSKLRSAFFDEYPSAICDFCTMDTRAIYPWTSKVLDIHHVLPLCSGARTSTQGTVLKDLVANCPTCHRAVHRYYDVWLNESGQSDFADADEARFVYGEAKKDYQGVSYAHCK